MSKNYDDTLGIELIKCMRTHGRRMLDSGLSTNETSTRLAANLIYCAKDFLFGMSKKTLESRQRHTEKFCSVLRDTVLMLHEKSERILNAHQPQG